MKDNLGNVNVINSPKDCDFVALSEDTFTYEKEHAYEGQFTKGDFSFELTADTLKHFADESNRYIKNGNKCDLPVEHTTDPEKNRGQVSQWNVKTDSKGRFGLFSVVKFRDKDAAVLAKTAQTSIFAPPEHKDGAGHEYIRPIRHVALTDNPVIPGLDNFTPIAASLVEKKGSDMSLKKLATAIGLELSEEKKDEEIASAIEVTFSDFQKKLKAKDVEFSEYKAANPPKSDPVKISKANREMLIENRELKLSQLVENGRILPCVKKQLQEMYCTDTRANLVLSETLEDDFNELISALKDNDPIKLSETTGPQVQDVSSLLNEKVNPVIANAKKMAEKMKV